MHLNCQISKMISQTVFVVCSVSVPTTQLKKIPNFSWLWREIFPERDATSRFLGLARAYSFTSAFRFYIYLQAFPIFLSFLFLFSFIYPKYKKHKSFLDDTWQFPVNLL